MFVNLLDARLSRGLGSHGRVCVQSALTAQARGPGSLHGLLLGNVWPLEPRFEKSCLKASSDGKKCFSFLIQSNYWCFLSLWFFVP